MKFKLLVIDLLMVVFGMYKSLLFFIFIVAILLFLIIWIVISIVLYTMF